MDEQELPFPQYYPDTIPTVDQRYSDEVLVRNARLCETDLREWYISHIDKQMASVAWKEGRRRLVMTFFDNSKVLSWLDSDREGALSTRISVLKARILINLTHAADHPSDRKSSQLITFDETLINNYEHFISRASGMRERDMQSKISTHAENTQTIRNISPQPEKRGIGGALDMFKH